MKHAKSGNDLLEQELTQLTNALIDDKYIRHSNEVDIHSFYGKSLKDSENNVRIGNKADIKHIVTFTNFVTKWYNNVKNILEKCYEHFYKLNLL